MQRMRAGLHRPAALHASGRFGHTGRRCVASAGGSGPERTRKDPSLYRDIEELRRELEQATGQPPFTITRTIQWLSEAANKGGANLAFKGYRWVLGLDQTLSHWRPPTDFEGPVLLAVESRVDPETIRQLQALLLIPRAATLRLISRCPALEAMPVGEVMARLVTLKGLFPASNVARMVELVPTAFLGGGEWEGTMARVEHAAGLLREGLAGADVDAMFEEDPTILFEPPESLQVGLRRMRELWDVPPSALSASDPQELALAVRALGLAGPPKSY